MTSPMVDLPEHAKFGVDKDGNGPVSPEEPEFDHWACWCGTPGCIRFLPHILTTLDGAAYPCSCSIGVHHDVNAWMTCPVCLAWVDTSVMTVEGHTRDAGCMLRAGGVFG